MYSRLDMKTSDESDAAEGRLVVAEPLSGDDLGELLANLRSAPLGRRPSVRLSLAGVQEKEKLLLARMPDETVGVPAELPELVGRRVDQLLGR
jgi:hypothetical protein